MQTVDTRHGKLHYLVVGHGSPFILLHGNTYSAQTQERLAARFADAHCVFSFDLLGHGQSARPSNLFSLEYFNLQGEALADALQAMFPEQSVPVFGMSAGGITALNAICHRPERISALILDGVFRRVVAETIRAHRATTAAMSPSWHRFMNKMHGEDWWPILNHSLEETIAAYAAADTIVTPCLEAITVPTLLFHGGKDPFVPDSQAQELISRIRGARMVYEAEAGHLVAWRNPDAFRERVRRFLQENRLSSQ